jgi:hypothetical protein
MNISGKWKGYYEFGEGYMLPYFGEKVEFEAQFYQDSQGRIKGIITELPSKFSIQYQSTLEGFIEDGVISFIKRYPNTPEINDEFEKTTHRSGNLEVNYGGIIDEDNDALYGVWSIQEEFINHLGHNDVSFSAGIWLLKRF